MSVNFRMNLENMNPIVVAVVVIAVVIGSYQAVEDMKKSIKGLGAPFSSIKDLYNPFREDQGIDVERQSKELKKMETLAIVYQEFRQWIENEAWSSFSRISFTEFEPSEVDYVMENQNNMSFLGKGTFGSVHMAVFHDKTVAMKILNDVKNGEREFQQEVKILRWIRHPNLVILLGACSARSTLMYEFLPNGTLEDRLTKEEYKKSFSWKERVRVANSICTGLVFLHNTKPAPIAHSDLKPLNILFNAENVCKLGDFGISRVLWNNTNTGTNYHITKVWGTGPYLDPEFLRTGKLTTKADVYAFGIILLQLVTGQGATGLRELVREKMEGINMENKRSLKPSTLMRLGILDSKLKGEWDDKSAVGDAMKILSLGIKCSELESVNRPSLETEVWPVIYSMNNAN